ncbi:MAG TPA: phosphoadenylyl-sulfate reductase [Actinomycetota bacterium]|nr:phosphoadenylyl-sulfate reductase [Actinomycetota bacterium]
MNPISVDPRVSEEFASPDVHFAELATAPPQDVLSWAFSTIGNVAVATSFQSSGLVILHMTRGLGLRAPVLFIDTGFHFGETIDFRRRIADEWDLDVVDVRGEHRSAEGQAALYGPELYRRDPEKCCFINKVEPLQAALEGYDGWISGIRRDQSPLRAETPTMEAQMLQSGKEVLKIHPLAHWSRDEVAAYVAEHSIPTHPLLEQGYRSIGCSPCTRAVRPDEDERAGRWSDLSKTECGIHLFGKPNSPRQSEAEQ